MITCSRPEAIASSTAYWMVGLSISGSTYLDWALVTGRKRVASPAAGKMARRTVGLVIGDNVRRMATSYDTVEPGLEGRIDRVVDSSLLTGHAGGEGLFSTPSMIMLMELAAHAAVEGSLPAGHTTV